jgi:hypothetical protein
VTPLAQRLEAARPTLDDTDAAALFKRLKNTLIRACNEGVLTCDMSVVFKQLQKRADKDETAMFAGEIHPSKERRATDFRRDGPRHFVRDDGAWLSFSLTVRQHGRRLEILAYAFELVLPDGVSPPFLRFDLNQPGHNNDLREIRSHFHPGNDDLLAPAPIMTPEELLDLLLWRLRPRDPDAVRATSSATA